VNSAFTFNGGAPDSLTTYGCDERARPSLSGWQASLKLWASQHANLHLAVYNQSQRHGILAGRQKNPFVPSTGSRVPETPRRGWPYLGRSQSQTVRSDTRKKRRTKFRHPCSALGSCRQCAIGCSLPRRPRIVGKCFRNKLPIRAARRNGHGYWETVAFLSSGGPVISAWTCWVYCRGVPPLACRKPNR